MVLDAKTDSTVRELGMTAATVAIFIDITLFSGGQGGRPRRLQTIRGGN
jgi:hypothetical protein